SQAIQRFAWLLVLLPGVVVWRIPVVLPVLPARHVAEADLGPEFGTRGQISDQGATAPSREGPKDRTRIAAALYPTVAALACAAVLGGWVLGMVVVAARAAGSYLAFVRGLPPPLPAPARWEVEV